MNKVNIIIPSYNHKNFLNNRLKSIVEQTFTDWQLIIIDDNSIDGSIEVLNDFVSDNKNKIKYYTVNNTNSGSGYSSWKKGIELADSEYIWIAETDDYSDNRFLEKLIQVLDKNRDCALAFCSSNYVDENNKLLYDSTKRTNELNVKGNQFGFFNASVLIDKMPFKPYITNGSSVVFRNPKTDISSEIFENHQCSDIFLWTYLSAGKEFAFVNEKLNYFRRHDNSTTTKNAKFKQVSLYSEKAKYLNYFNQPDKFEEFANNYIKYYINSNKTKVCNISPILKIDNVNNIRLKYLKLLVKFYWNKIFKSSK